MSKIILENEFGVYTIENKDTEESIDEILQDLVVPLLRAAGYGEESIKEWISI